MLKVFFSSVVFTFAAVMTLSAQAQAPVDCAAQVSDVSVDPVAAAAAIKAGDECAIELLAELANVNLALAAEAVADIVELNPEIVSGAVALLGSAATTLIVAVAATADVDTITDVLLAVNVAGLNSDDLAAIDNAVDGAITDRTDISDEEISDMLNVIEVEYTVTAPASSSPS